MPLPTRKHSTAVRQYPLTVKRNERHNLEPEIWDNETGETKKHRYTKPTHNATGIRLWNKRKHKRNHPYKPDHKPIVNASGIVPMGDSEKRFSIPPLPNNRVKPTDQYIWNPVHKQDTPKGKIVIESNVRGEHRFAIGDYKSLSVYVNFDSAVEAVQARYKLLGEESRPVKSLDYFSDNHDRFWE